MLNKLATAITVCAVLLTGAAHAQSSDPLPPADPGMQWQQTFGDEFDGTSVDTSKWNGEYGGGLQWAPNAPQNYNGVIEGNGQLIIQNAQTHSDQGLNTGGPTLATAKFAQRFGYFSVRSQNPPFGQHNGVPLWIFPIGKSSFPNNPDCTVDGNEEIDHGEGYVGNNNLIIAPDPYHLSFSFHDFCFNNQYSFEFPGNVDTSAGMHVFGLQWENDGSPHGSFIPYFDGNQLSAPIPTDYRSNLWDNGAYILLEQQSQGPQANGDFITYDWVHAYQQVAVNGTPTPTSTSTPTTTATATPTATPTPTGSFSFTSPVQGATVSGTIAVTYANVPSGAWIKTLLPNPPVNGQCAQFGGYSIQFDNAWGGCSLYSSGSSFNYPTTLLANGNGYQMEGMLNGGSPATSVSFNVNNAVPTPTPTPGCVVSIASPVDGASVNDPVTVTLSESNCGADFNRLQVTAPGTSYHIDFTGTTLSLSLGAGTFSLADSAWSTSRRVAQIGQSPTINVIDGGGM